MDKAFFTKRLDAVQHEVCGKMQSVTVIIRAFHDEDPYDGDIPEAVAAFERGDFSMAVVQVKALLMHLEASDILGGVCYASEQDLLASVSDHGMVVNALAELGKVARETLELLTK